MNPFDFSFEESAWDAFLRARQMGDTVSAAEVLTILEEEEGLQIEEALEDLETGCLNLDISGLPRVGGTGEAAVRLRREAQLARKGLKAEDFDENDPLRLYMEEIAMTPAFGDEALLAAAAARGDEAAMAQLTNLGLGRVMELSTGYVGYGVLLLDLIQEGSMGLWQAIRNYRYGEYAAHRDRWIRFYMAKAVTVQAHSGGVGQKMRAAMEDYRAVDERLLGDLGRNPTLEEIAEELHMGLEETAAVKKMLDNAWLMNRKQAETEEPEETPDDEQAVENTALFHMRQRISELLSGLQEKDQKLLTLRFGLEGGKPMSPEEVGRKLGLTPEEVVAKEAAALAKLRNR